MTDGIYAVAFWGETNIRIGTLRELWLMLTNSDIPLDVFSSGVRKLAGYEDATYDDLWDMGEVVTHATLLPKHIIT
jgi:hypothetical protein